MAIATCFLFITLKISFVSLTVLFIVEGIFPKTALITKFELSHFSSITVACIHTFGKIPVLKIWSDKYCSLSICGRKASFKTALD